jgi:hypothetical protein
MVVKSLSLFGRELLRVERNRSGEFSYTLLDGGNEFIQSEKYLEMSLTNPVLMTICALRSKIYSQMQIKHINAKGDVIENSPYTKILSQPNFFQSQQDFLFQQMWFLSATGNCYTYQKKAFTTELPKALYNLVPSDIDFNKVHKVNNFIVTDKDKKAYGERLIKYTLDNTEYKLKLSEIIPFYDLANGLKSDTFMISPSRVKGIIKVLENIEQNLKAKHINLQMSQKYLATNKSNMQGVSTPLKDEDRTAIERVLGSKSMQITNNDIQVNHLVSDMKKLFLDDQFSSDSLKCLLAFDMNKDILNYSLSGASTYENQEKGELRYLQNSIQTTADSTMGSFSSQWGLIEKGEKLIATYDHLNIMQPVMNEKIATLKTFQEVVKLSLENGTMTEAEAKQKTNDLLIKLGM